MPDGFRWQLVDDGTGTARAPDQLALFDADELVDRHVGTGEFRGLEFLHVRCRTIVNTVPSRSRMPFGHTINAYRGCSHACSYCLAGDASVLMAGGRTKPLRALRPDDIVIGTERVGRYRRFVSSVVLDHWTTSRDAWRVRLADGTELIASEDHRFLTGRGWKHVTGTDSGRFRRPHLTTNDELLGTGSTPSLEYRAEHVDPVTTRKRDIWGYTSKDRADLRVVGVEPLGVELPMYDITTTTGDFIANGVVSHNCFARPTHEYLGLGIGEDFERKIVVKVNAVERLRAELAPRRWPGHAIAMGTNTDPYQRAEGKYHLTKGIVAVLAEAGNPFSILTKSTLILRDLDLLADAARLTTVHVNLSIGTLDEDVWRLTEPGTPHPQRRIEAVARLNAAGIACGVVMGPVIPGLSDHQDQLAAVVDAAVAAGATSISSVALHLRPGVREHFLSTLRMSRPDLAAELTARYRGAYLPKADQRALSARVRELVTAFRG